MIEVLQGALGSGKSAVATARALSHIQAGGVVAANFSLIEGWSDVVADQHLWSKVDKQFKYEKSASMHNRFFRVNCLDDIRGKFNVETKKYEGGIPVKDLAVGKHKTHGGFQEGQGLLILDECQLVFNSRKWEKNMDWIQFFTQTRKLGWNVLLIAHTIEMIDSQIRPLAEYESRFRNLSKVKIPILGVPLSPYPVFLVVQRYAGLGAGSSVIAGRELYPLPLWSARLYDSLEVFDSSAWGNPDSNGAQLCGKAPAPLSGVGASLPVERVYNSILSPDCLWSAFDNISQPVIS